MTWSTDWLNARVGKLPPPAEWLPAEFQPELPEEIIRVETAEAQPAHHEPEVLERLLEAERETLRNAAYDEGYRAGLEAGRREEASKLAAALAAVEAATEMVLARQTVPEEMLFEHVLTVSLAVARHIIAREVRGDQQAIADLVRRALTHFPIDEAVRIRVNPRDLSTISTVNSDSGNSVRIAPGRNVQWIPDPQLASGECIVEGRQRIVDGRIDRALERMYHQLVNA